LREPGAVEHRYPVLDDPDVRDQLRVRLHHVDPVAADIDRGLVPGPEDTAFDLMAKKPNTSTSAPPPTRRRVRWTSAITVFSAAILIAAEVFGAAYAGGWALANLLDLNGYFGEWGTHGLQIALF